MPVRAAPRLALLLLLGAAAAWMFVPRGILQPAELAAWLVGLGIWAPILFLIAYVLGAVLLVPAALLTLVGGAVFGPLWGAVLDIIGATLGAGVVFLLARYLAADWVAARVGGRMARLIAGVEADGWRFVAAVRLLPVLPYAVVSYALGLTRIAFWPYLAASAVCMVPAAFAYSWLGYAGRAAAAGDRTAISFGLLGLGLLGVAAFIPRVVRRLRPAA